MGAQVDCVRCRRTREAIAGPTYPGALGEEIQAKICAACWADWQAAEVMVINELRLNFMDPASGPILERHLREFLFAEPPASDDRGGPPPR